MKIPIEDQIGFTLANETGMPDLGVCIWRKGEIAGNRLFKGTVGEFLSKPENQSGTWLIDGGWGGPPGAIHVRFNEKTLLWENGGFCGVNF